MDCPKCAVPLEVVNYEGVQVDRCKQCKGVWLDDGEIVKIVQTKQQTFDKNLITETLGQGFAGIPDHQQQKAVNCPKCQSPMKPVNYDYSSGIILDRCPQGHGIWFDGGELEKVQIVREQSEEDFQKNKADWIALANLTLNNNQEIADENRKRNMRPTKYLVNSIIHKIIGH